MRKFTLFTLSLALAASIAAAAPLTPQQALSRATSGNSSRPAKAAAKFSATNLVYTEYQNSDPMVYVFTKANNGYILVSADDIAAPVLGFCDSGNFDAQNMPSNLRWWLSCYASEISASKKAGAKAWKASESTEDFAPISPLCKTQWNQDEPYSNLCPIYEVSDDGKVTHCATGCVATAMAQLMAQQKWPPQGRGSIEYDDNGTTRSTDFSEYKFNWDLLANNYETQQTTEEQDLAVAQLMKACGYSVQMQYGYASGTYTDYVLDALLNYFDYGYETTGLFREAFKYSQWIELIYSSIAAGCSVTYSGANLEGGHAFICDGYLANNYFHINWGWAGTSDGYFLLNALDPSMQGIGGSNDGYDIQQYAIIMAKPMTETSKPLAIIMDKGNFSADYDADTRTISLNGEFFSWGSGELNIAFGLAITDDDNNVQYIASDQRGVIDPDSEVNSISAVLPQLAAGKYSINPVFTEDIDSENPRWNSIYYMPGADDTALITVDQDGNIKLEYNAEAQSPIVSNFKQESPIIIGKDFSVSATVYNPNDTEIRALLTIVLCNMEGEILTYTSPTSIDLAGKETRDITYNTNMLYTDYMEAGKYWLTFGSVYDEYEFELDLESDVTDDAILVNVYDEGEPILTCSDLSIVSVEGTNPTVIECKATLSCTGGYFADSCVFFLCDEDFNSFTFVKTPTVYVADGETKDVTFTLSFDLSQYNSDSGIYGLHFQTYDYLLAQAKFDISANGIKNVTNCALQHIVNNGRVYFTGAEVIAAEVYTLDGRPVNASLDASCLDLSSLNAGIYFIKATTSTATTILKIRR